ncbi:MAG: hypothetical protein Q9219_001464 [cf. Caloplaca sp. 3 TL-2023]
MVSQHISSLDLFLLVLALPFSLSLDCYPPPRGSQLPLREHCDNLVAALIFSSRRPHADDARTWGRGLPSEGRTESLPKLYWLTGREERQTCAVNLDADPLHLDARETFRLRAVGIAAGRVEDVCLRQRGQIGRDQLGPTGQVVAELIRFDSPIFLQTLPGVKGITVPGFGNLVEAGKVNNSANSTREETE